MGRFLSGSWLSLRLTIGLGIGEEPFPRVYKRNSTAKVVIGVACGPKVRGKRVPPLYMNDVCWNEWIDQENHNGGL